MKPRRALITGITGQDGSYLAELLLAKGYEVYGVIRRASTFNTDRIEHLYADPHEPGAQLRLIYGDLADGSSLNKIIRTVEPDEHYISIKKNFANIDDAVRRFKDEEYRRAMVERAYEYVMESHTYRHRVESLLKTVVDDGLPSQ